MKQSVQIQQNAQLPRLSYSCNKYYLKIHEHVNFGKMAFCMLCTFLRMVLHTGGL